MNSSGTYTLPSSQENLINRGRQRRKYVLLVPIVLILAIITVVVILNLRSNPKPTESRQIVNESNLKISKNLRLPRAVSPLSYKINLIPHLDEISNFTIDGKIWMQILCLEETTNITFHAKNILIDRKTLNVTPSDVTSVPQESIPILDHVIDKERDFYILKLNRTLVPGGRYVIYIEFKSRLQDDMTGFYRSSYVPLGSKKKTWIAVTQFEPTDARKAFPCFDEPNLKAEFKINLARKENMTTVSNMNIMRTEPNPEMPGWFWDHYERSLPMPTYLVAFLVSDFTFRESTFKSPISGEVKPYRVWARKDAFNQTAYALQVGVKVMEFFENYFGVEYPLSKMDLVAVPDFINGAMENWGMITFKESDMLYDPDVTPEISKDNIASTIAHETAHQWFGDLVTPMWWSDLWLNEGFATYMEFLGADFAEPTWKKTQFFISDEIHQVFLQDVHQSSHSVSVEVNDPDEINELFDGVTYDKGASLIRMMDHFLTHATFQAGLKNYLNKWKFNNTNQSMLWDVLTTQAHLDGTLSKVLTVKEIMDTWTLQNGFPVVKVERNYRGRYANFTQEKFRLVTNGSETGDKKWFIPISCATPTENFDFSKTKPMFWMSNSDINRIADFRDTSNDDWLIVNVEQAGYYRVNYDLQNWALISAQLTKNSTVIPVLNRAQIIDDALNLARASQLSYDVVLNLTSYLKDGESEYLPWKAFFNGLSFVSKMVNADAETAEHFKTFISNIISTQYKSLSFEAAAENNSTLLDTEHRSNIVAWSCYADHSDCLKKSKEYFAQWVSNVNRDKENPLPLNLRKEIYCSVMRNASEKLWNFLLQRYIREKVPSAMTYIAQGLSCSRNATILKKFANMALGEGSTIKTQDSETILKEISRNSVGARIVFKIMTKRWEFVKSYVGAFVGSAFRTIGDSLNTEQELVQLQEFKRNNTGKLGSSVRAVDEAIEKVKANVDWMNKNFESVGRFLSGASVPAFHIS